MAEKLLSNESTPSAGALAEGLEEAEAAAVADAEGVGDDAGEVDGDDDGEALLQAATRRAPPMTTTNAFFRGWLTSVLMEPVSFLNILGWVAARRLESAGRGTWANVCPGHGPQK
jgi:hypothetical protein